MGQKMVRQFCQWIYGETPLSFHLSLELKYFIEPFLRKLNLKILNILKYFFPPKLLLGHYNPHFFTFSSSDMIDIMYCELDICCRCQKMPKLWKKNWKMGEIWKIFEFLIWSTRFTDCITALKILKWGFSNIFHVVGNNKTEILSTWSGQKVKMGFL